MEASEILVIKQSKTNNTILGTLSIVIEGKNSLGHKNVLLIEDNSKGAKHPFRAVEPITGKKVTLTPTRIYDAYIALDRPMPENLKI